MIEVLQRIGTLIGHFGGLCDLSCLRLSLKGVSNKEPMAFHLLDGV
jgi:hypothetical protein